MSDSRFRRYCLCILPWLAACAAVAGEPPAPAAGQAASATETVRAFPAEIELEGAGDHALVVFQRVAQQPTSGQAAAATSSQSSAAVVGQQITDGAEITVADPTIARYENGRVEALRDGATELIAKFDLAPAAEASDASVNAAPAERSPRSDKVEVRVPLTVTGTEGPRNWEFDAHVQSVLTRAGCNSGACHGALAGKGGFRLSLRAYDSRSDHFNITRQDRGRRIDPAQPGRSLILAKPTGLVEHKGGIRLKEGSEDYQVLAQWIAAGAPPVRASDPSLVGIEVLPKQIDLARQATQQLIVLAHYSNGRVDDVTHWAKFSSADESVAQVSESGHVSVIGHGKGSIVAWFASRLAIASIVSPYDNQIPASAYAEFHPANFIDEILLDEWQRLNLAPSPGCSDETFIRRAYLDTVGVLPTAERVRAFLGDSRSDRRERLVDELLSSDAYVDYWSYKWSDLLLINGNLLRPDAVAAFYKWVRQNVEDNTPWDEMTRQIVLARGDSLEQGATNFYAIHQDPESLTENTCQAFLGLSIGCAKCHNHPLEKWTNDQYYSMANLYARVRAKGWGGDARNGDGKRTLVVLDQGDLIQPSRGKPQPPAPLDAEPIDMDSTADRREALAAWLTSPDNPYFSRAIANRVWANYMGTGLVEAVDDMRASNPASSERLLRALAEHLQTTRFDLKGLMRLILTSQAYQRSADAMATNADDHRLYCRYAPRRLMAEVLHDAVCQVTGVPTKFTEIEFSGSDKAKTDVYKEGTSALQLHDAAVANYFLKTFGRHQRRITCDCERSDQPTVVQVLHLSNGDTLNNKLSDPRCVVSRWIEAEMPLEGIVVEAYLTALSRLPSAAERKQVLSLAEQSLGEGTERRLVLEDLLWSLMTSPEFLFAH